MVDQAKLFQEVLASEPKILRLRWVMKPCAKHTAESTEQCYAPRQFLCIEATGELTITLEGTHRGVMGSIGLAKESDREAFMTSIAPRIHPICGEPKNFHGCGI